MTDTAQTLADLVDGARFAMLTSTDAAGALVSRPMTIQEIDGNDLLFITQASTDVAQQSDGRAVNLAIVEDSRWVSIAGTGKVAEEPETKQRLWDAANDAFTQGGADNPDNVVLRVSADSAEYWDSPGGLAIVFDIVKAKVTGETPHSGDHGTVEL